jgi:hypothetical protein
MPADSNFVWLRDTVSTIVRATLNGSEPINNQLARLIFGDEFLDGKK